MPLGAAPSAGLSLPPASRARKVPMPMRESEQTLWKASRETARICNAT
jgi:hypothetical protein